MARNLQRPEEKSPVEADKYRGPYTPRGQMVDATVRIAATASLGRGSTVGANVQIGEYAHIGDDVIIGNNVIVEAEAELGDRVVLDHNVVIREATKIASGTAVGVGAILGQNPSRAKNSTLAMTGLLPPLTIGEECQIGVGTVVYAGADIGPGCFIADSAQVRERCQLGRNVVIGRGVTIENDCTIGDNTKVQTGAYITAHSSLSENVFIAPMVTTTNDNYVGRTEERFQHRKGVTVEKGGRIGGNAVILPGVTVHQEALVGAGSVVTKDVPDYSVAVGVPARFVSEVPGEQVLYPRDSGKSVPISTSVNQASAKVPAFDLTRQNAELAKELMDAIAKVVTEGHFILGDEVARCEEGIARLCGVRHAVGVANGSDALYLALLAFGIGPGDEVITTPFSFFATAGSVVRAGATPVFCDIDPVSFNLDPRQLEGHITLRTRAILPVHLYGQPADMDPILEIADRHHLLVIEDAAQALGARYKDRPVGSLGHAACISFFPTKNLGAFGDGGMVVTHDDQAAERLRMLRVHGSKVKYHHELLGINSRLDALQAAILNVKLQRLEGWTERRRQLATRYTKTLSDLGLSRTGGLVPPEELSGVFHVYHQYTIRVQERDRLREYLGKQGIETSIYYPLPLHLQPVFRDLGYQEGSFPHAEGACREAVSLPLFPEMTELEQKRVTEAISDFA